MKSVAIGASGSTEAADIKSTAPQREWELQYQDMFDRPQVGPDWEATGGEFAIVRDASTGRGVLHGRGEIMLLRRFRGDVRVEMQASSAQPCDLSVTLGTSDAGWYGGYFLGFGSAGNTATKILRKEKQVAASADKIVPGASHKIVAEKSGSLVTMTVDGREILRFEDDEPLYGPKHEMIGLYLHNLSTVDFVKVYGRQGETPVKLTELPKAATPHMFRGEDMGWKDHNIRVGDGKGGFLCKKGESQFLLATGFSLMPFGLAQMDNGEVILIAAATEEGKRTSLPVVAFSKDRGETWSDWERIPDATGRPMMLAYLGEGNLTFQMGDRYHSHDYGRTWPDKVPVQLASNGMFWGCEGNPLVEFNSAGELTRIAEIGWNYPSGSYPVEPCDAFIRWSNDSGRTWVDESQPAAWKWEDTYEGKTYKRSVSEGSLVRADDGRLVAGLRTDLTGRWIPSSNEANDNYEGIGVSASDDNGKTWTPIEIIHRAGRMHVHFVKMPNGDLVMIYVMRQDITPDGLHYNSYRRGCGALVSRDNGLTWDVSREYMLHEFDFATGAKVKHDGIGALACGHTCSTMLDDGSILTAYGHYVSNGIALIRWKP